ncbi:MAG: glycoside hydrolase family 97 catalytic domain-containing protein [Flavobacteriaceae bacterium]|nr:glycoside hydrolase family 97 catalytic domain-containing protein [Flavobacteriaceae bacterium]
MKFVKLIALSMILFSIAIQEPFAMTNEVISVHSPDGEISLELSLHDDEGFNYRLFWKGQLMIDHSKLSILPSQRIEIIDTSERTVDQIWNPTWGQFSTIRDHFNEITIDLNIAGAPVKLFCRVYNNGIAFRFMTEPNQVIKQATYHCDFNFLEGSKIHYPLGEREPVGPISVHEVKKRIRLPVVVEHVSGKYLSLLESDLYSAEGFSVMQFQTDGGLLYSSNPMESETGKITTPWRVILLEDRIGDFVTNSTPLNLATPNQIEDTSWIKPGKSLWDWRVIGYKALDGFKYGANTESYLRFIDFASDNEIEYFLIDAKWYRSISEGVIEHQNNLDIARVSAYSEEKGVDLILYYDRKRGHYGDDKDLFDHYQALGMKGIKYGFMKDNVPFTRRAVELSAQSKLHINFHDNPVPFTGIRRTFPNAFTREYCHAQQDARRAFTPESFIKMALVNAIQGPLDMTNGIFDITGFNQGERARGPKELNTYYSTVASEAARTLIIFSGLVCLPDAPEAYTEKADLFEFIQKQPVGQWDESKVIDAKIGSHISTARRHGEQWFVGSVASQKGITLKIALDFLKEDTEYEITFYEDTENTHCKTNPEAYRVRKATALKGDVVNAILAPGGGHCMWIKPKI